MLKRTNCQSRHCWRLTLGMELRVLYIQWQLFPCVHPCFPVSSASQTKPDKHPGTLLPQTALACAQVSVSVLSSDAAVDPDTLAVNAACAALAASDVPCAGPAGAVRVASAGGQLAVNPKPSAAAQADLEMLYVGTANRALFVELQACCPLGRAGAAVMKEW